MAARWESLVHTPLAIQRRIRLALRDRQRAVLIGPWSSEVGFELLYWIPFLRKLFGEAGISPGRVIAVSRGGAAPWYHDLADRYHDLMEPFSHDEYLEYTHQREREQGVKKQLDQVACERVLLAQLSDEFDQPIVFHPSLMYRLFAAVWRGMRPTDFALDRCRHVPVPRQQELPEDFPLRSQSYSAVKLYCSDAWPDNEKNREHIRRLLAELAKRQPLVVLQASFAMDEHRDHAVPAGVEIIDASRWLEPRTNLAVQTAIVAHAAELHTTYGGFAYLGGLLDTPTRAYYSRDGFVKEHLEFSSRVFAENGFAEIEHRHLAESESNP